MTDLRPRGRFLLLVDGSSIIHRNFHALPSLTRKSDGLATGALFGFANTLMKATRLNWTAIGSLPSHAAVILDRRGKNWRHELYEPYKQNRKSYDQALLDQLPHIPTISEAFGVPAIGADGYEADDLICSYVERADAYGLSVVIATSDKDLCSLIGNYDGVSVIMYDGLKDKIDDNAGALIGPQEVYAKFGVMPNQIMDFLAITGDNVDNVPGVPGLGPKAAARLLNDIGDLDAIMEAAEWDRHKFKSEKEADKIAAHTRELQLSRRLVDLRNDAPLGLEIEDLVLRQQESRLLRAMCLDYEFYSLMERVDRPTRF